MISVFLPVVERALLRNLSVFLQRAKESSTRVDGLANVTALYVSGEVETSICGEN